MMVTFETILTPVLVIFELSIVSSCIIGDWAISTPIFADRWWFRALADATTHGVVGLLSWAVVLTGQHFSEYPVHEVVVGGMLATSVDIDHFIAAASLSFESALSLKNRPPFHNSTLIPIITGLLYCAVHYLCPVQFQRLFVNLPLIFFVAWSSHHIRDATRRGLWFAPFGSTPPLPTWLYRTLICTIPLILRVIMVLTYSSQNTTEAIRVGLPSIV